MSEAYFNTNNKSTNVRLRGLRQKATHALVGWLWRRVPALTRKLALRLFFSPGPYRTNAAEEACLEQGRTFQIKVNDKIIKGWQWGRGPGVLLVHGWNGRGIQFHGFVAPLVKAGYTAVAIDGPAHGDSTGRITSYFEFTDTVRYLLSANQNSGIQGIIAHSFGAGAVINALVKEGLPLQTALIAPVLHLRELLFNTLDRIGIPASVYTSLIKEFEARFDYSLEKDNPHLLMGNLAGSALIVHDEKDRTIPVRESRQQERKYPNISLHTTSGLGHKRILTDEKVINRCVAHMLRVKATAA